RQELFGWSDGDKFRTDSDAWLRCDEVFGAAKAGDGSGDGASRDCAAATESKSGDRCSHERRMIISNAVRHPERSRGIPRRYLYVNFTEVPRLALGIRAFTSF